ncbi:MAG TPA: polysaccharide biosynthesis/export family protein [Sedimentisphaerales bacterium]|nr:polysaccharide biosynthesis/export family protein [Sedimentisphaerales bacterium]
MTYIRMIVILSFIMMSGMGCFSSSARPEDIEAFLKPHQVNVTAETYILQPPDEIEVRCSKVPEIHEQRQQIRPDGKISFESLGEIEVAGKTVEEVANILRTKVLKLYKIEGDKPVDVRIVTYRSKVFYVLGEVFLPGAKVYTGRDTVLRALAEARTNAMAWEKRVQVIRPSSDENVKPKIFEMNFERMIAHGDTSKNVLLQEGDIIYVPPTILSAIAQVIEEFARPIGRAFSTVYIVQRAQMGGAGGGLGDGGYGYSP